MVYANHPVRSGQPEIISNAFGDVNGDGVADHVYLTAVKSADPSSPYLEQIIIVGACVRGIYDKS